jgi:hypothetical protein
MRVTQARRDIRRDRTQLIVMTPSDNKPKKKPITRNLLTTFLSNNKTNKK